MILQRCVDDAFSSGMGSTLEIEIDLTRPNCCTLYCNPHRPFGHFRSNDPSYFLNGLNPESCRDNLP